MYVDTYLSSFAQNLIVQDECNVRYLLKSDLCLSEGAANSCAVLIFHRRGRGKLLTSEGQRSAVCEYLELPTYVLCHAGPCKLCQLHGRISNHLPLIPNTETVITYILQNKFGN